MPGSLAGKVALVTGGGSGIGQAAVRLFAREGAKVVVADVQVIAGVETVEQLKQAGGEGIFVQCDVSKSTEVEVLINKCVETYGQLDCAFNNAGVLGEMAKTADCTEENYDHLMAINLKGVWLCMKYEIRQMLKQQSGVIVNTASNAGMQGQPELPVYGATKAGIVQLTKTAALEYIQSGLRINCVNPSLIWTPMVERQTASNPELAQKLAAEQKIGRIGKPEEIAEAVIWLCSDAASFVTGHPMNVDGGQLA
jgi:NAD(P)-dependent dehydrogenase (short-subunit alcohol dehydrogenase family)